MELFNLYKKLEENPSLLQFEKCDSITFNCPSCGEQLIKHTLTEGKLKYKTSQPFLYEDGDTIHNERGDHSKVNADMVFGPCEKCGCGLAGVEVDILSQDVGELYETQNDKCIAMYETPQNEKCLVVKDPQRLIKSFDSLNMLKVTMKNEVVGYMLQYKGAELNNDALFYRVTDTHQDFVYRFNLECIKCELNMNNKIMGVCNGQNNSSEQELVWDVGSKLLLILIERIEEYISTGLI